MVLALHHDFYIPQNSAIHQWPAKTKLLCLLAMMFSIALIKQVIILPWVLIVVLGLYRYSKLPIAYLLRRLPYPGLFILATVLLLPFTSGTTVIWQWGWLALRHEGLMSSLLIAGRFISIVVLGFILLGTTPFLALLGTMRSLKVPSLLTDMTLLTYRYLFDVAEQLSTMRQAMTLRGYGSHPHSLQRRWSILSSLFGSLLVRSYDQSQRVYQAMRLRGYGQGSYFHSRSSPHASTQPRHLTFLTIFFTLSFIIAEWSLTLR